MAWKFSCKHNMILISNTLQGLYARNMYRNPWLLCVARYPSYEARLNRETSLRGINECMAVIASTWAI
jgi:hypothetical protein